MTQVEPADGAAGTPSRGPGRVLAGRYEFLAEIGRGGMGVVWRAEDRVIGRRVAIKELRLPLDVDPDELTSYQARVLREARNAGRLSDPSVVTVHDVVKVDDSIYIVMELVEAPTLSALVKRDGPMETQVVAEIGRQLLSALGAAHAAGIVHRDVKPSNILVTPDGRAKLTDFGIAHALDDPTVTSTGVMMGSPAYIAPERLLGQPAAPASDLWSLGAALYYAVEGHPAYERDNTAATLHAVVNDYPYLARCQGALATAILALLVPNPAGRITPPQVKPLFDAAVNQPSAPPRTPPEQGPARSGQNPYFRSDTPSGGVASAPPQQAPPPAPPPYMPSGTPSGGVSRSSMPPFSATQPPRRRNPAWAWVTAGLVAGLCFGGGVFTGDHVTTQSDGSSQVTVLTYGSGGQVANFTLGPGLCGDGTVAAGQALTTVDCAGGHDVDVYGGATPVRSTSAGYPPSDVLAAYARHQCWLMANTTDVSSLASRDHLDYAALVPSQGAWAGGTAEREVYCLLWSPGTKLTGALDTSG